MTTARALLALVATWTLAPSASGHDVAPDGPVNPGTGACERRSSCRGSSTADATALLQVWVAEAGWFATREHAAIAHVLRRYAERRGVTLADAADALVWRHSNAQADRPWLRYLDASCARPDYVSARAWERRRPLCVDLVRHARAFLRGELRDPCPRAEGWRARGEATRRAKRHGWAVACAMRGNAFVRARA